MGKEETRSSRFRGEAGTRSSLESPQTESHETRNWSVFSCRYDKYADIFQATFKNESIQPAHQSHAENLAQNDYPASNATTATTSARLEINLSDSVRLDISCETSVNLRMTIFSIFAITERLGRPPVLDTVLPPVRQPIREVLSGSTPRPIWPRRKSQESSRSVPPIQYVSIALARCLLISG